MRKTYHTTYAWYSHQMSLGSGPFPCICFRALDLHNNTYGTHTQHMDIDIQSNCTQHKQPGGDRYTNTPALSHRLRALNASDCPQGTACAILTGALIFLFYRSCFKAKSSKFLVQIWYLGCNNCPLVSCTECCYKFAVGCCRHISWCITKPKVWPSRYDSSKFIPLCPKVNLFQHDPYHHG